MRTQVRRACGHCSIGPSAVVDQSSARIRVAISPLPANTDSINCVLLRSIPEIPRQPTTRSENKPAHQLNLPRGAGGGQDLARVSGEITRGILEDGIPRSSQEKRTLGVTRNAKVGMVEKVISFRPNRDLPSFRDRKLFVQRGVKLREPRPPHDVSSGIAKLTGRRNRKSAWIKPARRSPHSGPIRTASSVRVANQVRTLRNNQRLDIGIVEVEQWGKRDATVNVGNRRDLPAAKETSAARQLVNDIGHEIMPNIEIGRAPASLAIENVL